MSTTPTSTSFHSRSSTTASSTLSSQPSNSSSTTTNSVWGPKPDSPALSPALSKHSHSSSSDEEKFEYAYSTVGSSDGEGEQVRAKKDQQQQTPRGSRSGSEEFEYVSSVGTTSPESPRIGLKGLTSNGHSNWTQKVPSSKTSSSGSTVSTQYPPAANEVYSRWAPTGYDPKMPPLPTPLARTSSAIPIKAPPSATDKPASPSDSPTSSRTSSSTLPFNSPPPPTTKSQLLPVPPPLSSSNSASTSTPTAPSPTPTPSKPTPTPIVLPRSLSSIFQSKVAARVAPSAEGVLEDSKGWYDKPNKTLLLAQEELKKLQDEIKGLIKRKEGLEEMIKLGEEEKKEREEEEEERFKELEKKCLEMEKVGKEWENVVSELEEKVKVGEEKYDQMEVEQESIQEELRMELARKKGDLREAEKKLEELVGEQAEVKDKLAKMEKEVAVLEGKLKEAIDELISCEDPDPALKKEIANLKEKLIKSAQSSVDAATLEELQRENVKLKGETRLLREDKVGVNLKLSTAEEDRKKLQQRLASADKQYAELKNSTDVGLAGFRKALDKCEDERDALKQKLKQEQGKESQRYSREELLGLADSARTMTAPGTATATSSATHSSAQTQEMVEMKKKLKESMERNDTLDRQLQKMKQIHATDVGKAQEGDLILEQMLSALTEMENNRDDLLRELGRPIPQPLSPNGLDETSSTPTQLAQSA